MTVTQLAGAMLCTRGNATRLVRRLVELGLVQTRSAEHDQRIVVVTTTPQGKRAFRTADKLLREAAERRLAGISARDQATLARVTRNLSDLLRRDLAETSAAAALKR
jgi:DNA-binding MarR family transcriptional regulator